MSNSEVTYTVNNGKRLPNPHGSPLPSPHSSQRLSTASAPAPQRVECPEKLYALMHSCWHFDPHDRPTFAALKDSFVHFFEASYDDSTLGLE